MFPGIARSIIKGVESGSITPGSTAIEYLDANSRAVSYADLVDMLSSENNANFISLVIMDGTLESVMGYLWSVRHSLSTIVVSQAGIGADYHEICAAFSVHMVISNGQTLTDVMGLEYRVRSNAWFSFVETKFEANHEISSGTTLLATSGSTGNPKFVCLSNSGIVRNAEDIASMLAMSESDVSAGILPLSYSYGLSVLHSTLLLGGRYLHGPGVQPLSRNFLKVLEEKRVTHLPGVPFTHDVFERIGVYNSPPKNLKCVTQAGGRLAPAKVMQFSRALKEVGIRFHPMYGQTEASARISIMPYDLVQEFPGHVGHVVHSGALSLSTENSEILFEGPNVMLGYVEGASSLRFEFSEKRTLATGDRGEIGPHGLLQVTGRLKRIAKINGTRVDLDVFSASLDSAKFAAVESDGKLVVAVTSSDLEGEVLSRAQEFGLQRRDLHFIELNEIPRLENGKPDFKSIKETLS